MIVLAYQSLWQTLTFLSNVFMTRPAYFIAMSSVSASRSTEISNSGVITDLGQLHFWLWPGKHVLNRMPNNAGNLVNRLNFLDKDTIAVLPLKGYNPSNIQLKPESEWRFNSQHWRPARDKDWPRQPGSRIGQSQPGSRISQVSQWQGSVTSARVKDRPHLPG